MLFLFLCLLPLASADFPQQLHLSLTKDLSEMAVTWVTFEPEEAVVSFRKTATPFWTTTEGSRTAFVNKAGVLRYIYRATMTALLPATNYAYQVGVGTNISKEYTFRSLPTSPPYRVCVFGDLGVTNGESIPALIAEGEKRNFDVIIHVGDIAYDLFADGGKVGDEYFNTLEPLFATVPYMVIAGNHEEERGENFATYRALFTMPDMHDGENHFYSFDLGPVHFVGLSSEWYVNFYRYGEHPVKKQHEWLQKDLTAHAQRRSEQPWLITYLHRPFYCSNDNSKKCTEFDTEIIRKGFLTMPGLEPTFEDAHVDITFAGHEHSYERFYPQVANFNQTGDPYHDATKPTYIVTGTAGCHSGITLFDPSPVEYSAKRITDYGYARMTIFNSTHLYFEQIAVEKNSAVVDSIWFTKSPARIESYNNPAPVGNEPKKDHPVPVVSSDGAFCHPHDVTCRLRVAGAV